jgi:hypothetical protein
MKKIQYSYLPADSAAAGNSRENKKEKQAESSKIPPPDEATVARLNALAREYPYCAWGKPKHNSLL